MRFATMAFAVERTSAAMSQKFEISVPQAIGIIPISDCWTDAGFADMDCCNLAWGPLGNEGCWDDLYNFLTCCVHRELRETGPEANAVLAPTSLEEVAAKAKRPQPPVGDECFPLPPFRWDWCCLEAASCWNDWYSLERCCLQLAGPKQGWLLVLAADPRAQCLQNLSDHQIQLLDGPSFGRGRRAAAAKFCREQGGRFLNVASANGFITGFSAVDDVPSFLRRDLEGGPQQKELWPARLHFIGSLCLPSSCDPESASQWAIPRLVPWWRYDKPDVARFNETHVWLPPPLARQRTYAEFRQAWIAVPPTGVSLAAEVPRFFQFAAAEYRYSLQMSPQNLRILVSLCSLLLVRCAAAALQARRVTSFFQPLVSNFRRLGGARGSRRADLGRLALTAAVAQMHICCHAAWAPLPSHWETWWAWHPDRVLVKVNVGFVVLQVYLASTPHRGATCSWPRAVFGYTLRRWLSLAPMLAVWTYAYLEVMDKDVPLNSLFKSHSMYQWYGQRRDVCSRPWHLLPS
ncbi:unnamed protein product [Polarella glacialis]|uniref:Uncharacterized protein n=1 Tax=Polarella glacialis TaxID=89957 RepID=A0A813KCD7_POLGL|nr:unnamed protein product [Polarella glacialis]